MERIVSHFVIHDMEGSSRLYEVDYTVSPYREGVLCYAKVPCSERPCTCAAPEVHALRSSAPPS